jgi:hypothetical protein
MRNEVGHKSALDEIIGEAIATAIGEFLQDVGAGEADVGGKHVLVVEGDLAQEVGDPERDKRGIEVERVADGDQFELAQGGREGVRLPGKEAPLESALMRLELVRGVKGNAGDRADGDEFKFTAGGDRYRRAVCTRLRIMQRLEFDPHLLETF